MAVPIFPVEITPPSKKANHLRTRGEDQEKGHTSTLRVIAIINTPLLPGDWRADSDPKERAGCRLAPARGEPAKSCSTCVAPLRQCEKDEKQRSCSQENLVVRFLHPLDQGKP